MSRLKRHLVTHTFVGRRFDDHGVPLEAISELGAFRELLVETAKALWRRHHPDRQRLPKSFEDSLVLKFYGVEAGSAAVPIARLIPGNEELLFWPEDELDEAVELVGQVIEAAAADRALPAGFPGRLVGLFANYGKSLQDGEYFELRSPKSPRPAVYSPVVRDRLTNWRVEAYEDDIDLVGTVTMARISPQPGAGARQAKPKMLLLIEGAYEVDAVFEADQEDVITTALKEHATAKVRVQGRALFTSEGQLQRITRADVVTLLPAGEVVCGRVGKPIWEVFRDITGSVPPEVLEHLPPDAATEHDHYLYGMPKKAHG